MKYTILAYNNTRNKPNKSYQRNVQRREEEKGTYSYTLLQTSAATSSSQHSLTQSRTITRIFLGCRQHQELDKDAEREEQARGGRVRDILVRGERGSDRAEPGRGRVVHRRPGGEGEGVGGPGGREELLRGQARVGDAWPDDLVGRDERQGGRVAGAVPRLGRGQAHVPLQGIVDRHGEAVLPRRAFETRDRRDGGVQVEHLPLAHIRFPELPLRLGPIPGDGQVGGVQRGPDLHARRRQGSGRLREDTRRPSPRRDRLAGARWRRLAMG